MKPAQIGIYVAILILLCGYYGYFEVYRPAQDKQQQETASRLFAFDPQKIDSIHIERGETIDLKKTEQGWKLTSPVEELADQNAVGSYLASLSDIRSGRSMGQMDDDSSLFAKQMNISANTAAQSYKLTIGSQNPTKDFRYAKASSKNGVFLIGSYEAGSVDRDLFSFRSKALVDIMAEAITGMHIKNGDFSVELIKDSSGAWHVAGKKLKINSSRLETFVRDACWLQATMIADNMQVGSHPSATIELVSKDKRQSLVFWKLGKALFAQSSLRPQVVGVDPEVFAKIPASLTEIEDRALFDINPAKVSKVSIGDLVFTHAGGVWSHAGQSLQNGWKLENMLEMVASLEYDEILAHMPQGLKTENSIQIIRTDEQGPLMINLYDGAIVETGGNAYRVDKKGFDMVMSSLDDFAHKGVK